MAVRLPTRVAHVAALAAPDDGQAVVLGMVDPGGGDAPAVLDAVEARLAERGVSVLRATGRRLERDHALGAIAELVELAGGPANLAEPGDPAAERTARDVLLD